MKIVFLVTLLMAFGTQAEEPLTYMDPLVYYRTKLCPDCFSNNDALLRIVRDYNADGLKDQAIGYESSCGNKTCGFIVWLQNDDGTFTQAGNLGGLWWGYRIISEQPGVARWESCSQIGNQRVTFTAFKISRKGIVEDMARRRVLTEPEESESKCRWENRESFPCERCELKVLAQDGHCAWSKCE